ncbi:Hypothetical protein CINCED_3A020731 [Cinara cedri]|uniref:HAT, C-terminal dimerisation domain n=1 Tax=Cinara cedri TaxID=506608 RepID=A0A5E4NMU8_9HEMI|nr:Hypothetical protein CINCED_3A020731 [Cinara cedri]
MLESLYTFFGNSILRWAKLKKESCKITRSLKRLCPTRWSSRIDCLVSLNHMYPDIMKSPGADIGNAADLIKSTLQIIEAIRMNIDILIEEVNDKALKWNVTPKFSNKRTIKVKRFYDELCQDQRHSQGCQYFKTQVLYRCIDTVVTQLRTRYVGLNEINDLFSCILRRGVISDDDIIIGAKKLADEFKDFNPAELARQIESFNILFSSELESLTVDSTERSLSKLKLIKSYHRNTMSQTRLSSLAMISIEYERAKS